MTWLLSLFVLLVLASLAAWRAARGAEARTGLPRGRVIYSDTGFPVGQVAELTAGEEGVKQESALVSRRYGLVGRPDYLVRAGADVVPVEAKSTKCPPGARPYDSHTMQLAAYCLLVEDALGGRAPYGVIRYRDCEVRVDFTPELKEELLALLEEMRAAREAAEVHRSHEDPRRCAGCRVREACDESLAD